MYSKNYIIGFKGFDKDLKCRDFQYEVGKYYEQEGEAVCCERGFHFCENPLEVFEYYPPCTSRFCQVEGGGSVDKSEADSKVATSHIHISSEIGLNGLIDEGVKYILNKVDCYGGKTTNTGNYSVSTRTTRYSAATNTGNYSTATNTGFYSAATNTGAYSVATNSGNKSAATNTGCQSAATNSGYKSAATNTGDNSSATSSGKQSTAISTGAYSLATVQGNESVAVVTGRDSMACGTLGSWIVLTERGDFDGEINPIKEVKAFKVDGVNIKENTPYKLVNGQAVAVI